MAKKKPFTPVANAAGVKSETIKAAADVVVNDAENVSNTVSSENTEKEGIAGTETNTEKEATTITSENTEKEGAAGIEPNTENEATTITSENTEKEGTAGIETNTENGATIITSESVVNETFEFNGKNYKLAPFVNKLQVDGRVYQREEILTNKEIMASLIIGNSPFIKKA